MSPETLAILISVFTLLIVGATLWQRRNEPTTLTTVVDAFEDAVPLAQELGKVAEIGVQAAEQLYLTGKLPRDERLNYALNFIKSWSPAISSLDNEKIYGAIEAAVLVANALSAQAKKTGPVLP